MSENYMIAMGFIAVLIVGILIGLAMQSFRQPITDYDEICTNAGYHRAAEIEGDWHCATPIYGFNGVLMNSEDPTP